MSNKFKKGAVIVAGTIAMMGVMASAEAAQPRSSGLTGQYANVQLAMVDASGLDSGTAIVGTLGFPMPDVNPFFSFEGELSKVLGKPKLSTSYTWFGTTYSSSIELDYWTLAGYGVLTYPMNDKLSLRGRLGLLYENAKVTYKDSFAGNYTGTSTDTGLSFGFGGTYKVSPSMKVIAEYTQIESDITHLSVGVQVPF